MTQKNDGGSVHPHPPKLKNVGGDEQVLVEGSNGISLRDHIAIEAMAAAIVAEGNSNLPIEEGEAVNQALKKDMRRRSEWAYMHADTMLEEREK